MLSEDRKREGLAQKLSIIENTTLSRMTDYTRLGLLNLRQRRLQVGKLLQQLQVKCRDGDQPVSQLSGGNQQKVAIARILHQQSTILLLDEPTKGIDVGTKAEIYKLMGSLAAQGRTLIFVSSYLPELLAICDRIGVMSRGRLIAAKPADQWSEESIMHCAVSGESN
jgi:ribose transport system ATP-binding protein